MNQTNHKKAIEAILHSINAVDDTPFVLKGGTALMECYELDRFSEDIELDVPMPQLASSKLTLCKCVDHYCALNDATFCISEDTNTSFHIFLHLSKNLTLLKIEASYRHPFIPESKITKINGIKVYTIDALAYSKGDAYAGSDKMRNLYDVVFLYNNHYDKLSENARDHIRTVLSYKGSERFYYLLETQNDPCIDKNHLETEVLKAFEHMGLCMDDSPRIEWRDGFTSQCEKRQAPSSLVERAVKPLSSGEGV